MKGIGPYKKYKESGVAWLGEIPEEWKVSKLKFLLKLQKGKNPKEFTADFISLPYLSTEYLRGKTKIKFYVLPQENLVEVQDGDLLVLWDGANAGEIFKSKHGFLSSTMAVITPNESFFDKNYFYHFLKGLEKEFRNFSNGTTIPHFDSDILLNQKYSIPKSSEQTAIANFLDYKTSKIDRFIRKKKQLIKLLNEQKSAIINNAVTKGLNPKVKMKESGVEWLGEIPENWEVKRLKYVADCIPSNIDKHTKDGEKAVRLCNYTDVYKNDFIKNDMNLMLASATDDQIVKFTLQKNDVIITKDSETASDIAVPALVKEPLENVVCGYHLSVLRPFSELLGEYLFRALQCKPVNIQFEICSNGVTRVGLGVYDMKKAQIPVPPISEQKKIISQIEKETSKLNKAITTIEKEITLVQEYRTALIAEAVTGKIDVRNYKIPESAEIISDDFEEELEIEEDELAELNSNKNDE